MSERRYLSEQVAPRLRDHMQKQDLSQRELARRAGLSQSVLSRMFSGAVEEIQPETVDKLARALGVEPSALLPRLVFISYRRCDPDQALARFLADTLKKAGEEVFLDVDLPAGSDWGAEIQEALDRAVAFIVLLSKSSLESDYVSEEVRRAVDRYRKNLRHVIPVRVDYEADLGLRFNAHLSRFQQVSWTPGSDHALAQQILAALDTGHLPERHRDIALEGELAAYRDWALEKCEHLELIGVGGNEMRLDFERVFIPLRITQRDPVAEPELEEGKPLRHTMRDNAIEEIALQNLFRVVDRHALVFGDPGSGKTTALKKLMHSCLHGGGTALGLEEETLPVFLPLRDIQNEDLERPFEEFIGRELQKLSAGQIDASLGKRLWQGGRLLLLLDGLDEVASDELRAEITRFIDLSLPGKLAIRAVVSSRYTGYGEDMHLGTAFTVLDVHPLNQRQIDEFVGTWMKVAHETLKRDSTEARQLADDLRKSLSIAGGASQRIQQIVGSPLLLTLLCIVVLQGLEIPKRRVEFYERALRVLLNWRKRQTGQEPPVGLDTTLQLLRALAYRLHCEGRRDDLARTEFILFATEHLQTASESADPFALLDWLHREAGVLDEYSVQHYGFLHLGFQEYLAALELAARGEAIFSDLIDRLDEDWWRETLLLWIGLPDRAIFRPFVSKLLSCNGHDVDWADHREFLRACLDESPEATIEPFCEAIKREADDARRATLLRMIRTSDDPSLTKLVQELRLDQSADEDVRALAEQILERRAEKPVDSIDPWVFLAAPRSAQPLARSIAEELRRRNFAVWLDVERVEAHQSWMDHLPKILDTSHLALALIGEDGEAAWQARDIAAGLQLLHQRKVPCWGLQIGEAKGAEDAPDFFQGVLRAKTVPAVVERFLEACKPNSTTVTPQTAGVTIRVPTVTPQVSWTEEHTGIRFLRIPEGEFDMGADDLSEAKPVHRVQISDFYLAETPVTNAQYRLFLEATGHDEPGRWRDRKFSKPDQPVVAVNWYDASAFCEWLTEVCGRKIVLPTEAQWEYAARGGKENRRFPWGDDEPDKSRACFGRSWTEDSPDAVGSFPAGKGRWGTLDQAGLVWEWCQDAWDENAYRRPEHQQPDPVILESGASVRCLRGGSWYVPAEFVRSAIRYGSGAGGRVGFRVAASPPSTGS